MLLFAELDFTDESEFLRFEAETMLPPEVRTGTSEFPILIVTKFKLAFTSFVVTGVSMLYQTFTSSTKVCLRILIETIMSVLDFVDELFMKLIVSSIALRLF